MSKTLRLLPFLLLLAGLGLFGAARFAKSDITPIGQMDCGCGGGQECVTKNRAQEGGVLLGSTGLILMAVGALGSGVTLYRYARAR